MCQEGHLEHLNGVYGLVLVIDCFMLSPLGGVKYRLALPSLANDSIALDSMYECGTY